jgi:hypothetical protein
MELDESAIAGPAVREEVKVTDKAARRVDMVCEVVRVRVTGPSRERLLAIGQLVGFRGDICRLAFARGFRCYAGRLGRGWDTTKNVDNDGKDLVPCCLVPMNSRSASTTLYLETISIQCITRSTEAS